MAKDEQWAQALGWFSIGLGLTEVFATSGLAKAIGIKDDDTNRNVLRGFGVREIVNGIALLTQPDSTTWRWGRVAGDAMDLTFLGKQYGEDGTDKGRLSTAVAAVAGVTVLDVMCSKARHLEGTNGSSTRPTAAISKRKENAMDVKEAVTIGRSAEELYNYWHDFENLPNFMNHLEAVTVTGQGQSHWKAKAPLGATVEWDAEIVDDQPNRRIAWRSIPGTGIENWGSVEFVPSTGNRGTIVRVDLHYSPPGGAIGAGIAKLLGEEPEKQVWEDLHRFKQLMELGEITLSDASPVGMGSSQRPGQPLGANEQIKD
jgi:uncharacterized membrane protein